jgi:uncharacterized protein YjbI with pentapeptide repeats
MTGAWLNTSLGFTKEQLYSTASYQATDLSGIRFLESDLSGWDFSGQKLAGAELSSITGADFTAADLRGILGDATPAASRNAILPHGIVAGLELAAGETLVVRDDDGVPDPPPQPWLTPRPPIEVLIVDRLTMSEGSALQLEFDADHWDSLISVGFRTVELGGALELRFANDVDVSTQVGRTLRIFDWTGVSPSGEFDVSSSYLWDLSELYSTGEARLTGTGSMADYNGSGMVDQADLDLVILHWGTGSTVPLTGWANDLPIGLVDQDELDKVLLNWGSAASGLATTSVPEPSAAAILVMGVIAFAGCRRLTNLILRPW